MQLQKIFQYTIRTLLRTSVGVFLLASLANIANATTYTYTGERYATVSGVYTTSMAITGSFTTSSPLPANMPITAIGPGGLNLVTSWSFFDGVSTFTNANSVVVANNPALFRVATDATGNIESEATELISPVAPHTAGQIVTLFSLEGSGGGVARNYTCAAVTPDNYCTSATPSVGPTNTSSTAASPSGSWIFVADNASRSVPLSPAGWMLLLISALAALALNRATTRNGHAARAALVMIGGTCVLLVSATGHAQSYVSVSAGTTHSCALLASGSQLRNGGTTDSNSPVTVSGVSNAISVSDDASVKATVFSSRMINFREELVSVSVRRFKRAPC